MSIGTQLDPTALALAQADAFVTHAGMVGSSEGLMAGVPMVAVPQAEFMNADRLARVCHIRRVIHAASV